MRKNCTISIALATFNGARFLQEQLDSFLNQSRLPDELVVCDDASGDGTLGLLYDFAARAPFPVRIFANPQNLGFAKNFEKASCFCQGEVIVFSDQDDVWLAEKLASMERVFQARPAVSMVFHDATVVDENLRPLGYSYWQSRRFTPRVQKYFSQGGYREILFKRPLIIGAIMAIRRGLAERVFPIPAYWGHDNWLAFTASLITEIALIPMELIQYRQHAAQSFGAKNYSLLDFYRKYRQINRADYYGQVVRKWEGALSCLSSDWQNGNTGALICEVQERIRHYRVRAALPSSRWRRLLQIMKEFHAGKYHRHSQRWQAAIMDLLV